MRDVLARVDGEIVIGTAFLVIGVMLTMANLDVSMFRKISTMIWPMTLIVTGVYGLLLHGWRQKERSSGTQL